MLFVDEFHTILSQAHFAYLNYPIAASMRLWNGIHEDVYVATFVNAIYTSFPKPFVSEASCQG